MHWKTAVTGWSLTISYHVYFLVATGKYSSIVDIQRVPALRAFWDLEKTVLHEIRVSGTVLSPLLTQKFPTSMYVHKPGLT